MYLRASDKLQTKILDIRIYMYASQTTRRNRYIVCSDQLCTVGLDYTANMCDNRDTGAPLMMEENNRYELLS